MAGRRSDDGNFSRGGKGPGAGPPQSGTRPRPADRPNRDTRPPRGDRPSHTGSKHKSSEHEAIRADRGAQGARDGGGGERGPRQFASRDDVPRDSPGIRNPYVRFRPLPKKPALVVQPTTLWDYPSQHYGTGQQGSSSYRGATPSYVIWNCIQRYTAAGDVVIDPFCGSGTTLDVCADTARVGHGFDIAPFRDDIVRADARKLPVDDGMAKLVFFDPPYADNLAYSDDPKCIGKLTA